MSDLDETRVDALISIATASLQYPSAMKHIHQWAIDELAKIEKELENAKVIKPVPTAAPSAPLFSRTQGKG